MRVRKNERSGEVYEKNKKFKMYTVNNIIDNNVYAGYDRNIVS